jgi:antitoxin PrlF
MRPSPLVKSRALRSRRVLAEEAEECNMSTKPARKASNPHLGSDFDDFLREEGLYDEAYAMGVLRSAPHHAMLATLTSKGRVTIPKRIRDALCWPPGARVEFSVNAAGEVVLHQWPPVDHGIPRKDRFNAVLGRADVRWRTDELMKLLRAKE